MIVLRLCLELAIFEGWMKLVHLPGVVRQLRRLRSVLYCFYYRNCGEGIKCDSELGLLTFWTKKQNINVKN